MVVPIVAAKTARRSWRPCSAAGRIPKGMLEVVISLPFGRFAAPILLYRSIDPSPRNDQASPVGITFAMIAKRYSFPAKKLGSGHGRTASARADSARRL